MAYGDKFYSELLGATVIEVPEVVDGWCVGCVFRVGRQDGCNSDIGPCDGFCVYVLEELTDDTTE